MTGDTLTSLLGIGFGMLLAVHCPRAALREFKNGIGKGRHGNYERSKQPVYFWTTIIVTFLAGIVGIFFVVFGIGSILSGSDNVGDILDYFSKV